MAKRAWQKGHRVRVARNADPEIAGATGHVDEVQPGDDPDDPNVMVSFDDGRYYWVLASLLKPERSGRRLSAAERTIGMPWAPPPPPGPAPLMRQQAFQFRPPAGLTPKPSVASRPPARPASSSVTSLREKFPWLQELTPKRRSRPSAPPPSKLAPSEAGALEKLLESPAVLREDIARRLADWGYVKFTNLPSTDQAEITAQGRAALKRTPVGRVTDADRKRAVSLDHYAVQNQFPWGTLLHLTDDVGRWIGWQVEGMGYAPSLFPEDQRGRALQVLADNQRDFDAMGGKVPEPKPRRLVSPVGKIENRVPTLDEIKQAFKFNLVETVASHKWGELFHVHDDLNHWIGWAVRTLPDRGTFWFQSRAPADEVLRESRKRYEARQATTFVQPKPMATSRQRKSAGDLILAGTPGPDPEGDGGLVGIFRQPDGTYETLTYTQGASFKTARGAARWMKRRRPGDKAKIEQWLRHPGSPPPPPAPVRGFKVGDVVTLDGKVKRYLVVRTLSGGKVDLHALSGAYKGSHVPSTEPSRLQLSDDQTVQFSGAIADQLESHARMYMRSGIQLEDLPNYQAAPSAGLPPAPAQTRWEQEHARSVSEAMTDRKRKMERKHWGSKVYELATAFDKELAKLEKAAEGYVKRSSVGDKPTSVQVRKVQKVEEQVRGAVAALRIPYFWDDEYHRGHAERHGEISDDVKKAIDDAAWIYQQDVNRRAQWGQFETSAQWESGKDSLEAIKRARQKLDLAKHWAKGIKDTGIVGFT